MFEISLSSLALGCLLDLVFGDPYRLPHPIRWIGTLIAELETRIRGCFPGTPRGELSGGAVLVTLVLLVSGGVSAAVHLGARRLGIGTAADAVMVYYLLAARSLRTESMKVYGELKKNDLQGARRAVSMIVGRDTKTLDREGVTKAAVETVAENASDGVIAPLFYTALGGPVLGFLYKAVNTMDSMVGYKNEKYLYFGRAAARLDDLANFIPARISALFMIGAAFLLGMNGRQAVKTYRRDRYKHKSPNSAHTEAVCAGALGIRLAGPASYFGKMVEKPYIGDALRPVEDEDIVRANRLLSGAYFLAAAVFAAARLMVF